MTGVVKVWLAQAAIYLIGGALAARRRLTKLGGRVGGRQQ